MIMWASECDSWWVSMCVDETLCEWVSERVSEKVVRGGVREGMWLEVRKDYNLLAIIIWIH